jgi:thioester reductase-like protein
MSTKRSIKVCVRTRPTHFFAQDNIVIETDQRTVVINGIAEDDAGGISNNKQNRHAFKFDHVFHNASQAGVYDLYCRDTVLGVVEGTNGAILSYGQTGSGKTFTMVSSTLNLQSIVDK